MILTGNTNPKIVLIGAGIMSATLAVFLKELVPDISITIFERLSKPAEESSDAWNNAGTGHSAFCELNYSPEKEDGSIDISKAIKVAAQFEISKQFWAYLVQQQYINSPKDFITHVPHLSFVWGDKNVAYLKKRFETMSANELFKSMQFSEDKEQLKSWMPLVMQGRSATEKCAATKMDIGTDVNFGALTDAMMAHVENLDGVKIYCNHEVRNLEKQDDGSWEITVKNLVTSDSIVTKGDFVFIGAGGGSLPLLQKSDIDEAEGYGGFPISGQWLRCTNENIIQQHAVKVYGKASVGSPPMSVPHLDTRIINGKKELLFGPFAGFSTKFLKNGSYFDLPKSIEWHNMFPMLAAGWHNLPLTKYLIHQVTQSQEDRLNALKEYYPEAKMEDWELVIAGQRVQVIKKDEKDGGVLEFGTELVCAADGTIAALLGASPGASTAVPVMINVLKKCFPANFNADDWQAKLKEIVPTLEKPWAEYELLCQEIREWTSDVLELNA
ncbi:malate:quinone oxidoreductase [Ferruginibacter sp. SUN106]|uniref:malate:quinone oxidoreductase n=1 Tax=Ferruginibacter sp. SUN106 TaxID=2978348 RepID=UPI003D3656F4